MTTLTLTEAATLLRQAHAILPDHLAAKVAPVLAQVQAAAICADLDRSDRFFAEAVRDKYAPTLRPRPAGERGFITTATGFEMLAIRSALDGETYWRAFDHRDDWWPTKAAFTERAEDAHDSWCDTRELDDMCPTCAREAHPDRDEVV